MIITVGNTPVVEKPRTKEDNALYFSNLTFADYTANLDELEQLIGKGFTLAYKMKDSQWNCKGYARKKNYVGTDFICVDVDETDETPEAFLQRVKYKPTIIHTTFSNLTEHKHNNYCYHAIYVFSKTLYGEDNFYSMWNILTQDINFDKAAKDCKRVIFTSNSSLPEYFCKRTDIIYNPDDFDLVIQPKLQPKIHKEKSASSCVNNKITQNRYSLDGTFFNDMNSMLRSHFIGKYSSVYDYLTETPVPPEAYQDGYADLRKTDYYRTVSSRYRYDSSNGKPYIPKITRGNRNNILFIDAIAFMNIMPDMTLEHLVYCLTRTVYEHYDNDDFQMTNSFIIDKAKEVYNQIDVLDPKPARKMFKMDFQYWKRQGMTDVLAIARTIMKKIKTNDFSMHYDFRLTIEKNITALKEIGIKTTKRTLIKWLESIGQPCFTNKEERRERIIEIYKEKTDRSAREISRIYQERFGESINHETVSKICGDFCAGLLNCLESNCNNISSEHIFRQQYNIDNNTNNITNTYYTRQQEISSEIYVEETNDRIDPSDFNPEDSTSNSEEPEEETNDMIDPQTSTATFNIQDLVIDTSDLDPNDMFYQYEIGERIQKKYEEVFGSSTSKSEAKESMEDWFNRIQSEIQKEDRIVNLSTTTTLEETVEDSNDWIDPSKSILRYR